jgi:membrane protease YdiL (CAAX protease family)
LFGGFGVFLVASAVYGAAALPENQPITLPIAVGAFVLNVLIFVGATAVLGVWRKRFTWAEIGWWPIKWDWSYLFWAIGLAVGFLPIRAALAFAAQSLLGGGMDDLQNRADLLGAGSHSWIGFAMTLLWVGILVPISEELYFRGLLWRWFQPRLAFWPRLLILSALFGLAHFDSVGVMVSTFLLGLFCAYAYERTRSIWCPIAIHAVNNSLSVILLYFALWLAKFLGNF